MPHIHEVSRFGMIEDQRGGSNVQTAIPQSARINVLIDKNLANILKIGIQAIKFPAPTSF
jgi:hypothetical protein